MKIILFLIILLLSSCNTKEDKVTFFFYKGDLSSHVPLTCDDFNIKVGSSVLTIVNDSLIKEIHECIENSTGDKNVSHDNIDVRFKVILNNDTLCIDNFGHFVLNNNVHGKLNCYNKIIKVIEDNYDKASFINTNVMDVEIE